MRTRQYGLTVLALVMSLIVVCGITASPASATSAYDGVVTTTDSLVLQNDTWCPDGIDFSTTWAEEFITDPLNGSSFYSGSAMTQSQAETLFDNKTYYGVSQYTGSDRKTIIMWWTDATSAVDIQFQMDGPTVPMAWVRKTGSGTFAGIAVQVTGANCAIGIYSSNYTTGSTFNIAAYDPTYSEPTFGNTVEIYFQDVPVTYPSGYAGATIPTEPPGAKYVAMGDSFSSGEGVEPFYSNTDTISNACHRSREAWPFDVGNEIGMSTRLSACSGAISDYIIDSYNVENVELPQAAYISDDTQLVTITIGGNDVGFGDVLKTCTLAYDGDPVSGYTSEELEHIACMDALDTARLEIADPGFEVGLQELFEDIASLGNEPEVLVIGYPNLFPAYEDIYGACKWEGDWIINSLNFTSGRNVSEDEIIQARLLHDELNAAINNAVTAGDMDNLHFVDPSSEFVGHELCRPSPWFNGVVPSADEIGRQKSYHPNASGQAVYASVVEAETASLLP